MLNLPLPLIPPLYRMMLNEAKAAQASSDEVPEFTHYLVWGRGYRLEGGEEGMGLDVTVNPG
jgi:protein BCP1